jgi:Ca2+-binding RTX toxin-like protein
MFELAIPLILGMTTLAAFSGLFEDSGDTRDGGEEGRNHPPSPPGGPQIEGDYVDLGPDERGSIVGSDFGDTIIVRAETSFQTAHLWDKYEEEVPSPLDVRGGGGDDLLILEGSGYVVHGDDGADTIELREAANVGVFAGADDTVLGGSGRGNYILLDENAAFLGGAGDDLVHSSSTSPTHMGDGNDTYIGVHSPSGTGEVSSIVYGGGGDDYLVGSLRSESLWWEHASDRGYISHDPDTLIGGAGNDTIIGSHGDSIVGGTGNDHFYLALGDSDGAEGATVADFTRGEDQLEIRYERSNAAGEAQIVSGPCTYSDFYTNTDAAEGFAILNADGQIVAQFPGVGSLTVGFRAEEADHAANKLVDLEGNPISVEACDVVIEGLNGQST